MADCGDVDGDDRVDAELDDSCLVNGVVYHGLDEAVLMTKAGDTLILREICYVPHESPGINAEIEDLDGEVVKGRFFRTGQHTQDGKPIFRDGWVN